METGIGWVLLGALFLGTFALPSKYIKNYAWENTWGTFFLFGMLIVPVGFSMVVVKDLWATYEHADVTSTMIFQVVGLGFLWGCGFCCWGTGLSMVGLSLGYSLTMGTMALVGSMTPFFLGSADKAGTPGGMLVIAGILVCIGGVALNGLAGTRREKAEASEGDGGPKKNMALGLIVCVVAGVLSSGLNIAFHFGGRIAEISATEFGNPAWLSGLSIWTLIFLGGMISSCAFTFFLLCKNKTWNQFSNEGSARTSSSRSSWPSGALPVSSSMVSAAGNSVRWERRSALRSSSPARCSSATASGFSPVSGRWPVPRANGGSRWG
jgi:L-rhamnose-H+ transport protein